MTKLRTDCALSLSLSRAALAKALDFAARVAQRRTTIPIISNIRLTAEQGRLVLAATDLDLEAQTSVEADVSAQGETTVQAATLHEIIRKLAADKVTLEMAAGEDRLAIKAGRAKFHLATLPASDWPSLEIGEMTHRFALPAEAVARALKKTTFAISNEETRYYLNGVYVHVSGGDLRFVSTDGHRLAKFSAPALTSADNMPGVIIPTRAVTELARLAEAVAKDKGQIDVEVSSQKILFRAGETTLLSKLIDGSFPDYERVIPRANDKIITLDRAALTSAIERVATVVSERGRAVKLAAVDNVLTVSVTNPDIGDATEDLEVDYAGPPIEIGFNARYVTDALAALDGAAAQFEFNDTGSPAILRANADADLLTVLMPMRV